MRPPGDSKENSVQTAGLGVTAGSVTAVPATWPLHGSIILFFIKTCLAPRRL